MIRLTALNLNEHAIFSHKTLKTEVTDITETSIFQKTPTQARTFIGEAHPCLPAPYYIVNLRKLKLQYKRTYTASAVPYILKQP